MKKIFLLVLTCTLFTGFIFAQTGNVGIGTTTPAEKLDVNGNVVIGDGTGGNNIMYIRRISDGSGNKAGLLNNATQQLELFNYSGTREVLISSNTGNILFGDNAGTVGLSTEVMRINTTSGNVGIGTPSPSVKLDVNGAVNCTGGTCSSDRRWKMDIQPLENVTERIQKINGVTYYWNQKDFQEKNFNDRRQIGVIAQEVEAVFPELVNTDAEGFKSMDYQSLTAVLLEGVKEQNDEIAALKAQLGALENQNSSLTEDMEVLKAAVTDLQNNLSK